MSDPQDRQLLERIEKLEHAVATLQKLVAQRYQTQGPPVDAPAVVSPPPAASGPAPARPAAPPAHKSSFRLPAHMRSGEYWLGKIGIGLLLFGVAFLFKYSIDQGWLTPSVRVLFGLALGGFLVVMGLRLHSRRRAFSQLLLGGGVATFYICGFSAYQVLELVAYPGALAFMVAVTVLAFVLSLKEDEVWLALIGALGGLGTPFLLYSGQGSVPGLVAYTCIVLAGTSGIYFFKGWRSLLATSATGGWIVFAIARWNMPGQRADWLVRDQWFLELAALFALGAFWLVPVLREAFAHRNPERWKWPSLEFVERNFSRQARDLVARKVHLLTVSTPLLALFYSGTVWRLTNPQWGWITLAVALVYAFAAWVLSRAKLPEAFIYTHALVALLFFTLSLSYHLSGDVLFIAWTSEALVLHLVALRLRDRYVAFAAHALSILVAVTMVDRLLSPGVGSAFGNARAFADLWAVVGTLALAFLLRGPTARRTYLLAGQAALAALFVRELNGSRLLCALALQGVFVHLLAIALGDRKVRIAGHILFGAVAAWVAQRLYFSDTARLFASQAGPLALGGAALANLLALACGYSISGALTEKEERTFYRVAVHVGVLLWLWHELCVLPAGQAVVSISWGIYAVLLLVIGLRRRIRELRLAGLGTLLAVVGKLFLIDLANLAAIWRVLLFLGFGGLFLLLSYYFRALWKAEEGTPTKDTAASG